MRRVILLITLIALGTAAAAWADISTIPVKARMERPERLPAAGRAFNTAITIQAAADADFSNLAISGDGWAVTRWDGTSEFTLDAGGAVRFELDAMPRTGFGHLVLSAEVNGRPWRKTFDLSRETYGGILPTDSDLLPPHRLLPAGGEKFPAAPQFSLGEMKALAVDAQPAPADPGKAGYPCTVTGNLCYWHGTLNKWVPAVGAHVWAWVLQFGFPPYSVGTQNVDELGRFTIQVPDGVDISIGFSATSDAVVVQEDGIYEDNYSWTTALVNIPTGMTQYAAGPIYPNHHHGALHICTDVTYAHNNFRDLGWDVSRVDLQWPDDDGSFYSPYFEEIHIDRGDEWSDETICHEWGHYWHHMHAHEVEMDYCNGVCDDPGDCGHCDWCPENETVTWMEGCAQIISRLNTDYIAGRALFTPTHNSTDSVIDSPSCDWEPWNIENAFASAVYDMVDDDRGTETDHFRTDILGDDVYDQLNLEPQDILHIMAEYCGVEGHEPYRAPGFFRCAAEYIDNLGSPDATRAMLWETVWNFDLQIDEQAPGGVPYLTSSWPKGTPTQIAMGGFTWQAPADDMSGACAYSVQLNANTPLAPDHVVDTTNVQWWPSSQLAPGTYYFTVIAVDRAGRWGTIPSTFGPIIIEAPGPADLDPYTYSGWTAPLVLRSTLAPVEPDPVTQPNYIQGHTIYYNWGERNNGTGPSGNFKDCMYLDGGLVYTSTFRSLNFDVGTASRNVGPYDLGAIGRHTVWMRLDGLDLVPESDENDNIYAKQFVFTPEKLSLGETVVRTGGLPEATAGQTLLPGGTTFYPNGDGYDIDLCLFPELVWAVPDDPTDRLVMRLHSRDIGQTGFRTALATGASLADRPVAIIQNPSETLMTDYCIGVSDESGSGNTYRIHREIGKFFAMPDTLPGAFTVDNCLDFYLAYNELGEDAWLTIKLANPSTSALMMRIFDPGFAMGNLSAADYTIAAAAGDTVFHNALLPPGEISLIVVTRDYRQSGTADYSIFAYEAKPDLAAATPSGWFANVVPQIGFPYNAGTDPVPAPASLIGGADSTGFYWSLRNDSPEAGIPIGLRHQVELDGNFLFGSIFIDPLPPLYNVKVAQSSLRNIRGGRHTVVHRVNFTHGVDEDDYTNNDHGRQWVWAPPLLAAGQNHALPLPASPYGGLSFIDEGLVAPNCDGYRYSTTVPLRLSTILAVYGVGATADIDLGLFSSADVQNGFTTPVAQSAWSGSGGDFVLRYMVGPGTFSSYVGVTRASGASTGEFTLRGQSSSSAWVSPVGSSRSGIVETNTFLDTAILTLPAGLYRFTLDSPDESLGFSLHDLSSGYSAKSDPWGDGIAWQEPGQAGQDVSFLVRIEDPAPAPIGLVVWRPDGSSLAQDAAWTVTIGTDISGVDNGGQAVPVIVASRLVSAAPNPFNPLTLVTFEVAQPGRCELTVHDVRGRLVRTLVAGDLAAGRHQARWDGLDDRNQQAPSGIYMVRLQTRQGDVGLLKLTLVK